MWYIKSKSWKFSLIKGEERGNKCIFYADQTSTICQSSNVWQVGIDCSRPKCSEAVYFKVIVRISFSFQMVSFIPYRDLDNTSAGYISREPFMLKNFGGVNISYIWSSVVLLQFNEIRTEKFAVQKFIDIFLS